MKAHVTRHQGSGAEAAANEGGLTAGEGDGEEGGTSGRARVVPDPGIGRGGGGGGGGGGLGIGQVSRLELLQQSDLIIYTDGRGGVGGVGSGGGVEESRDIKATGLPARTYSAGAGG
jgi:hypothetical protein